jgi:hypothetical protein
MENERGTSRWTRDGLFAPRTSQSVTKNARRCVTLDSNLLFLGIAEMFR